MQSRQWVSDNWLPLSASLVASVSTRLAFVNAATALCTPGYAALPATALVGTMVANVARTCVTAHRKHEPITWRVVREGAWEGLKTGMAAAFLVSSMVPGGAVTIAMAIRVLQDMARVYMGQSIFDPWRTIKQGALAGIIGGALGYGGAELFKAAQTQILGHTLNRPFFVEAAPTLAARFAAANSATTDGAYDAVPIAVPKASSTLPRQADWRRQQKVHA